MISNAHDLARALPRRPRPCAATISPTAAARALLAGRRCPQHAGPLDVRPAARTAPKGAGGQMDRRRHRRAWRSARLIRETLWPGRLQGRRRGSAPFLSLPHPSRSRTSLAARTEALRPDRRKRRAGCSPCRSRSTGTLAEAYLRRPRHHGFARNRQPALPSALLLSARRAQADRDLAGDDRRRHRSRRQLTGVHRTWLDPAASARRRSARRRSTRRDGRWATCSAMPSASAWQATSWRPAKASRRCCRSDAFCPPCRWSPRSRPRISPPSCSRTLRRLYIARDDDPAGDGALTALVERATRPESRRSCCRRARRLQRGSARFGIDALRATVRGQFVAQDVARFMALAT